MIKNIKKITVIGAGYVGFSLSIALSKHYDVTVLEIDPRKITMINSRKSFLSDKNISKELKRKNLKMNATSKKLSAISHADLIFCCLPTNFNEITNTFDTTLIEEFANYVLKINPDAPFVIRSTVPIGFTSKINKALSSKIIFMPEFLREGSALEDTWYPSRIIFGFENPNDKALLKNLKKIFTLITKRKRNKFITVKPSEAEAIKLFSNTFLALRVGFFNELDSFALQNNLDSKSIISGLSKDKRIGNFYNNPSFGYGGYCLPKDTKQTSKSLKGIPSHIIDSIETSNKARKKFLTKKIVKMNPKKIGIYRLIMKKDSDNLRESASLDLLKNMPNLKKHIIIYEPLIKEKVFEGHTIENNVDKFLRISDIIVANRLDPIISKFKNKVFTRDIFNTDI